MKKVKFLALLMFITLGNAFVSCETSQTNERAIHENLNKSSPVRLQIIYITWDEWGRASKECSGWGLCNMTSCTFCCLDENDNIVPCPKNNESLQNKMAGSVEIDLDSNEGFLYIELDNTKTDQNEAIVNGKEFFIDQDISNDGITLHQGVYQYDATIGLRGGYKVNALKYQ
jgi:hypothetical protein